MRRRLASALVLGLTLGLATVCSMSTTVAAAPSGQASDAAAGLPLPLPIPGIPGACDLPGISTICGAAGSAISTVPNPIGAAAGFVAGGAEQAFTHWVADAAASLLREVLHAADVTLQPDLRPGSLVATRLHAMVGLAGGVALLFLLITVGQALLRGEPALMIQAALIRLPIAFGVTAALLFMTATAVAAVDQSTAALIGGSVDQVAGQFLTGLSGAFSSTDYGGTRLALVALCALATIVVGILLYAELTVRTAVVYVALLFLPLGLAASVWPGAGRVARRLVDLLITAILAKFVILVALWFAAALLAQAASPDGAAGFGGLVTGLVVLALAAGSPLVLLGLVAHAEGAVASMAGARRAAYAPARRAYTLTRTLATSGLGAGAGAAGAARLPIVGGARGGATSAAVRASGPWSSPAAQLGGAAARRATSAASAGAPAGGDGESR